MRSDAQFRKLCGEALQKGVVRLLRYVDRRIGEVAAGSQKVFDQDRRLCSVTGAEFDQIDRRGTVNECVVDLSGLLGEDLQLGACRISGR
jgi:hypothetical protein